MKALKQLFYKKYNHSLTISSPNGLHLRPVAKFVNISKQYSCDVVFGFNNTHKNAKNINSILELGASYQDIITLSTQGKDAKKAIEVLSKEFEKIMQEDIPSSEVSQKQSIEVSHSYDEKGEDIKAIYEGIAISLAYNCTFTNTKSIQNISLQEAIKKFAYKLTETKEDIFVAQKALLEEIPKDIQTLKGLKTYIETQISSLAPNMNAKAIDYQDILHGISDIMGLKTKIDIPTKECILVCDDLLPSQIQTIKNSNVKGVILKKASTSSHSAILLRSEGIVSAICDMDIINNTPILLDTTLDKLIINPSTHSLQKASTILQKINLKKEQEELHKYQETITKDGKCIDVLGNIQDINSALQAKDAGASSIGLLRSEFMFTQSKPTLQQQTKLYTQIFDMFDEITVRTLDVGGDKELPYIDIPKESNPFLGIRGIRLLEIVPDIIATQLLAIYKASSHKPIKIMFPMISTLQEFIKAKEFAHKVAQEHNIDISHIKFGMMIEVPLVVFNLFLFDKVVDFYSIGSNDLAQYSFAIQRGHPSLAYDESLDEFLEIISYIKKHTSKPLSICGEMASNPKIIKKLIDIGIDTISVSPANIAKIKEEIRNV